ncbi:34613_t:CDS:2, partial [Racocetra persica]
IIYMLLLVSLFIQTIKCQHNFGNGLEFILKYSPKPKEFKYDKDDEIFNKDDEYLSDNEDLSDNTNLFSYILEKIKT